MIYKEYEEKYKSIKLEKQIVNGKTVYLHMQYHKDCYAVTNEFRDALAKEYCSRLPLTVADKIFGKAWEDGHAFGYNAVESFYCELIDFVEDIVSIIVKNK